MTTAATEKIRPQKVIKELVTFDSKLFLKRVIAARYKSVAAELAKRPPSNEHQWYLGRHYSSLSFYQGMDGKMVTGTTNQRIKHLDGVPVTALPEGASEVTKCVLGMIPADYVVGKLCPTYNWAKIHEGIYHSLDPEIEAEEAQLLAEGINNAVSAMNTTPDPVETLKEILGVYNRNGRTFFADTDKPVIGG